MSNQIEYSMHASVQCHESHDAWSDNIYESRIKMTLISAPRGIRQPQNQEFKANILEVKSTA